jgi:hypothetical protein
VHFIYTLIGELQKVILDLWTTKEQSPHSNIGGSLCLPQFWAKAWFGIAMARFRLPNIEDEQVKFDLVVNSLSKECLRTVLNLVTNLPKDDLYKEKLSPPPTY